MITYEKFIEYLESDKADIDNKLDVINYFMSNYPVEISCGAQMTPTGIKEVKEWVGLKPLNIEIKSHHRPELIAHAYNNLVKRIKELKKFKEEND